MSATRPTPPPHARDGTPADRWQVLVIVTVLLMALSWIFVYATVMNGEHAETKRARGNALEQTKVKAADGSEKAAHTVDEPETIMRLPDDPGVDPNEAGEAQRRFRLF